MADLDNTLIRGGLRVVGDSYLSGEVNGGPATFDGQNTRAPLILKNGVSGYREGLRIMPYGDWSDILLAGNDASLDQGTSANSWFIGNNNGNFHITRNGADNAGTASLKCINNVWTANGYELITSGNVGSVSVNYATSAGNADTLDGHDSSYFATASSLGGYVAKTGDTMTGALNVYSTGSNRANINMISIADVPNDLYFGSSNTQHWSLTSRDSSDGYFFGLYGASGISWAWTVNYSTGVTDFKYRPTYYGTNLALSGEAQPASDVYGWAKQSTKPSYNLDEIGNRFDTLIYFSGSAPGLNGSVSPVGMSLSAEHSANRLSYINSAALSAEYSTDGETWSDMTLFSDTDKVSLVTLSSSFPVGRNSANIEYQVGSGSRLTITGNDANGHTYLYCSPKKLLINVSSSGGMNVKVEYRTGTALSHGGGWAEFGTYGLSGWSGWNEIPLVMGTLGGFDGQLDNNYQLRLTFIMTSKNTDYPTTAYVNAIRLYADNCWVAPSTMASGNRLYSFDINQNATFPGQVDARSLYENGTALSNKYLGISSKAADSDLLDGHDSSYFINTSNIGSQTVYASAYSAQANYALDSDKLDGYDSADFLHIDGGTMTGTPYINMPASAATISDNQPFGITYGRIQGYGTIYIAADTDGSTNEHVIITAGYGIANATAANGLAIGYNSLQWKGTDVALTSNFTGTTSGGYWTSLTINGTTAAIPQGGGGSSGVSSIGGATGTIYLGSGFSMSSNTLQGAFLSTENGGTVTGDVTVTGGSNPVVFTIGGNYSKGTLRIWDGTDGNYIDLKADTTFNRQTLFIPNEGDEHTIATQEWVTGRGYITGITSSMVTTALGYTPGTSNFSGSYNDLSNKPTIPTDNSQLTNGAGYITGITSAMVTTALGYTPGTSNFTGYTSSNKLSTDYIQNDAGYITSSGSCASATTATTATKIDYTTTAPSQINLGGLKVVVLTSEPAEYKQGYIYFIVGS